MEAAGYIVFTSMGEGRVKWKKGGRHAGPRSRGGGRGSKKGGPGRFGVRQMQGRGTWDTRKKTPKEGVSRVETVNPGGKL